MLSKTPYYWSTYGGGMTYDHKKIQRNSLKLKYDKKTLVFDYFVGEGQKNLNGKQTWSILQRMSFVMSRTHVTDD